MVCCDSSSTSSFSSSTYTVSAAAAATRRQLTSPSSPFCLWLLLFFFFLLLPVHVLYRRQRHSGTGMITMMICEFMYWYCGSVSSYNIGLSGGSDRVR